MRRVADGSVRVGVTAQYALAGVGTAIANLADGRTPGKKVERVG